MALKTKFFNTPILLITFNRPWLTQQVFDQIRKARPTKLYISNDGPRSDRKGEYEKCVQVRDIIKQVDWKCIVKTRFSEINQGCKYGPVNAINWFFESEEMGIILEDDCIPHPDFFDINVMKKLYPTIFDKYYVSESVVTEFEADIIEKFYLRNKDNVEMYSTLQISRNNNQFHDFNCSVYFKINKKLIC